MLSISDSDFHKLVQFIHTNYGIDLSKKRSLISGRLSGYLATLGYHDFHDYVSHILTTQKRSDVEEMLNRLTTNYTYFMREENHFTYFRDVILPWMKQQHQKDRVLSIWSAGCSSGQEPYTISMILKEFFGSEASLWDTRVLATDISQKALDAARKGIYEEEALQKLPASWRSKYFVRSPHSGTCEVSQTLRSNVIFRTFNLMEPIRFRLKFDVIFCRNVMIYFDQSTKDALTERFFHATRPGGYLLIGHSESLNKITTPYSYCMPAVYRRKER